MYIIIQYYTYIYIQIYIYIHLIQPIHVLEHVSPVTASLTLAAQVSCNPYGWIWWKAENSNTALEPAILSVQIRSFNWLGDLTWGILGHLVAQRTDTFPADFTCTVPLPSVVWCLDTDRYSMLLTANRSEDWKVCLAMSSSSRFGL